MQHQVKLQEESAILKLIIQEAPRYDPHQTEAERQDFNNLLLMCPIHHDVIDADEDSYTVERLVKIKADQETNSSGDIDVPDTIVQGLLQNIYIHSNTIRDSSILISNSLLGGQIGHSITNVGPQPRTITSLAADALISELKSKSPETVTISCLMNDTESIQTGELIHGVLERAGWSVPSFSHVTCSGVIKNILIETFHQSPALDILLSWFGKIGFQPKGVIKINSKMPDIIVRANL